MRATKYEEVKFGNFEEITLYEQAAGTIRTESCSQKHMVIVQQEHLFE